MKNCEHNLSELEKKIMIAKLNQKLFDSVYDAALTGKEEIVTDFIHPNSLLPFPSGMKRTTEVEVMQTENGYLQKLDLSVIDEILNCPNQIQALIWLPVSELWKWNSDYREGILWEIEMLHREKNELNANQINEYLANQALIIFKSVGIFPYDE